MKRMIKTFAVLAIVSLVYFQESSAQEVYNLWEGQTKPYYKENSLVEGTKTTWGTKVLYNITEPTLTVYKAKGKNTGKAVIILPGGGYNVVAINHEGYDVAKKLAEQGITVGVVKYRLPNPEISDEPILATLSDARRALAILKSKSGRYNFETNQVGVMGFSAGSHLASLVSLWESELPEENPDFSVLVYGSNNVTKEGMGWIEKKLYHRKMSDKEIEKNLLLNMVNEDTPPTFLVHAYNDSICHVNGSILYAQRLFENSVPVEMHLFTKGGHGFGLGKEGSSTRQWLQLFINWAKEL